MSRDDESKNFDCRGVMSARYYLMLVHEWGTHKTRVQRMQSGQPQSYYKCLMKDGYVAHGLGDKHYKAFLAGVDPPGDLLFLNLASDLLLPICQHVDNLHPPFKR